MRQTLCISVCLAGLAALAAHAEIVDRIAVSVGNRVITESDLYREIRLTAFLNGQKPDFSPESKRQTAERLVDQRLMRTELDMSRYLLPTAEESDAALRELKSRFPDDGAYNRGLAEYGIREDDLTARLTWQLTLVHFIDVRFRAGIQVSDEEVRNYFNERLRPILEKTHPGQPVSLDDYRDTIERTLTGEAADQQAEQWLKRARSRNRIVYRDEVFR